MTTRTNSTTEEDSFGGLKFKNPKLQESFNDGTVEK